MKTQSCIVLSACVQLALCKPFVQFRTAVFGKNQSLWFGSANGSSLSVAILPAQINNYSEAVRCDSCRWLSKNGLEFAFENLLFHNFKAAKPNNSTELIAPHNDLIRKKYPNFLSVLDTLPLPLNSWFDNFTDTLIIREKDRYTPPVLKDILSEIGGQIGKSHLLWPCQINFTVKPKHSTLAQGRLSFDFCLIFWNVILSYPEWILHLKYHEKKANLNETLSDWIKTPLFNYINNLPNFIQHKSKQEPK